MAAGHGDLTQSIARRAKHRGRRRGFLQEHWVVLLQILVAVATVIAVPVFATRRDSSNGDLAVLLQLVLGLLAFTVVAVAPLSASIANLTRLVRSLSDAAEERRREFGRLQEVDVELGLLQDAYRALASTERGLLVQDAVAAQIRAVRQHAQGCATTRSLEVGSGLHTTSSLLASLHPEDQFLAVHYCDNHNYLVGPHSWDFFRRVAEMARHSQLGGVRRILVYTDVAELSDPRTWVLATFHHDAAGYRYRLMSYDDYVAVQHEAGMEFARLDVGVFGMRYLYISSQNPSGAEELRANPYGRFVFAREEVERYALLFEECWKSHLSWRFTDEIYEIVRGVYQDNSKGRRLRSPKLTSTDALLRALQLADEIGARAMRADIGITSPTAPFARAREGDA